MISFSTRPRTYSVKSTVFSSELRSQATAGPVSTMVGDHVGIRVAVGSSFCRRVGRFSQQRPENHSPRLRVGSCALLFFHCLHCLGALGGTCFAPRESVLGIGRAWEQFPRPCLGTQLGLGNRDPPHAHSAVWETNWGTKPLDPTIRPRRRAPTPPRCAAGEGRPRSGASNSGGVLATMRLCEGCVAPRTTAKWAATWPLASSGAKEGSSEGS